MAGARPGHIVGQPGAVHDVGIQHLQEQVIQGHHVLHLHAVEVVHAFVTAGTEISRNVESKRENVNTEGVVKTSVPVSLDTFQTIAMPA